MRITLFEDDLLTLQKTKMMLRDICDELGLDNVRISSGQKESTFSQLIAVPSLMGLYILDIQSRKDTHAGVKFAENIRSIDPNATIVFYSSHPEHGRQALEIKVGAFDLINKSTPEDDTRNRFQAAIEHAWSNYINKPKDEIFTFTSGEHTGQVLLDDILFAEIIDKETILHLKRRRPIKIDHKLREISALLPQLFRASRSCIINPANVMKYDYSENLVYFEDGRHTPVSRTKRKELLKLVPDNKEKVIYLDL